MGELEEEVSQVLNDHAQRQADPNFSDNSSLSGVSSDEVSDCSSDLSVDKPLMVKMKDALMKKFGLEGSVLSDREQKIEETNQAMAAFLLLPVVVAITSRIPGFDHKNTTHAQSFMNEYKEQNGKGTTRS